MVLRVVPRLPAPVREPVQFDRVRLIQTTYDMKSRLNHIRIRREDSIQFPVLFGQTQVTQPNAANEGNIVAIVIRVATLPAYDRSWKS
jgi:hypothetical protein